MKSKEEILMMLIFELQKVIDHTPRLSHNIKYYNELMGDTSFLLAGLLENVLYEKYLKDVDGKWFDDCLID